MTAPDALPASDLGALPRRAAIAGVLLLTALCFAPGLRGELVYDDLLLVAQNPFVTDPGRLTQLISSGLWDFLDPGTAQQIGYWRPLTGLALALGHRLGGGAPIAFHLLALLVHLAATAATWRLARHLSRSDAVACATAIFFGLHPVHVEAVSWISAINDPLYGLFALLAADAWLGWRERGSTGFAWRAGALALLAMLSKEQGVAALLLVFVLDLALRRGSADGNIGRATFAPIARGYGVLCAAFAVYYLARAAVFGDLLAGFDRQVTDFGVSAARLFALRLEILGGSLWLLAWPFELQLFRPFVPSISLADPGLLRALIAAVLWTAGTVWAWRRGARLALVALLASVAALLPLVLRISSLGIFPLSERFLYLAAFGSCFGLALLAWRWLPQRAAWAAVAFVAITYGVRSTTRTAFWHDEERIFRSEIAASPRSPYVRWGLGRVLLGQYRQTQEPHALREAHAEFQTALDLLLAAQQGDAKIFATRDDHLQSNLGFAMSLLYEAEIDEYHEYKAALEAFEMIAERWPGNEYALTGAGIALTSLGRYDEALASLRKAIETNPRYFGAQQALGIVSMRRADWREAVRAFDACRELRPDDLETLMWLARARSAAGDAAGALDVTEEARAKHPAAAVPLVVQATLAAQKNEIARAIELVERALVLDRNDGEAWLLQGKLHVARREDAAAETAFVRATELMPLSFEAHHNAAAVLLRGQRRLEAMPYLLRAYTLRPKNEVGETLRKTLVAMELDDVVQVAELAGADAARGYDDDALDWIERILALQPDHGETHFAKARLLQRRGDEEGALASFRRAVELLPANHGAQQALGEQLVALGRPAEALPHLERALDLFVAANGANPAAQPAIQELRDAIEKLKAK